MIINGFYVGDRELSDEELKKVLFPKDTIAAAINLSFSSEILLKYLINKKVKIHNLESLFNKIDDNYKNRIIKDVDYSTEAFTYCLNAIANIFEDWRYFYEIPKDKRKIQFSFLKKFTEALIKLVKKEIE